MADATRTSGRVVFPHLFPQTAFQPTKKLAIKRKESAFFNRRRPLSRLVAPVFRLTRHRATLRGESCGKSETAAVSSASGGEQYPPKPVSWNRRPDGRTDRGNGRTTLGRLFLQAPFPLLFPAEDYTSLRRDNQTCRRSPQTGTAHAVRTVGHRVTKAVVLVLPRHPSEAHIKAPLRVRAASTPKCSNTC